MLIVTSCASIRCRRITGFVNFSACAGSAVGLSIVVVSGGYCEKTNENGFSALERRNWQFYA